MVTKKKKNVGRIHAAIAYLGPKGSGMGFPVPLIRRTIKNMFKVYGCGDDNDDAWALIEDNSYGHVMEAMLEVQQKEKDQSDMEGHAAGQDVLVGEPSSAHETEMEEHAGEAEAAGHLVAVGEPNLCHQIGMEERVHEAEAAGYAAEDVEPCSPHLIKMEDHAEVEAGCQVARSSPHQNDTEDAAAELEDDGNTISPLSVPAAPADAPYSRPRRKPCYGWISESESENEEEPFRANTQFSNPRKRKSGWDVKVEHSP